jgi:hypothetical protein
MSHIQDDHTGAHAKRFGPSVDAARAAAMAEQRRRWQAGESLSVESLLESHSQLRADRDAILDLISQEVVLRQQRGETIDLTEYQARFQGLSAELSQLFEARRAFAGDLGSLGAPSTVSPGNETMARGRRGAKPPAEPFPEIPGLEFVQLLGQGGMGTVYQAHQRALGRDVAVKLVRFAGSPAADDDDRIRSEARAAARLQHPNIVQLFEIGEHLGRDYLVLEYVEGGSLAQKLKSAPLAPDEAARLLSAVSRAVHYAHERRLVHRDLKPANILLTPAGVPKVADFGLAKLLDREATQISSGAIVGTPGYMAPEQIERGSEGIAAPTDVYGLGAVLYETLTGRPPFRGPSLPETLRQVLEDEPVSCRTLQPGVPRDLETICHRCLRKEPSKRYASAAELADDLERFLAREPVRARPSSRRERVWKWCRRRPAAAALVATVLLFVVSAAALLAWRAESVSREQARTLRNLERARREEQKARRNLAAALDAIEALNFDADGRPYLPAENGISDGLYERAIEVLDPIAAENPADVRVQLWQARLRESLALRRHEQGQTGQALALIGEAQQFVDRLIEVNPTSSTRAKRAEVLRAHAQILADHKDFETALACSDQSLAEVEKLLVDEPDERKHHYRKAQMLGARGDNRLKCFAARPSARDMLSAAHDDLAAAMLLAGQLAANSEFVPLSAQLHAECVLALARLHNVGAIAARAAGKEDEAAKSDEQVAMYSERAIEAWGGLARQYPAAPPYQRQLVDALRLHADWTQEARPGEYAARLQTLIDAAESLAREIPSDYQNRAKLVKDRCRLASLLLHAADEQLERANQYDQAPVRRAAELGATALAELRGLATQLGDQEGQAQYEHRPLTILIWSHALLAEFGEAERWQMRLAEQAQRDFVPHLDVAENYAYFEWLADRLPGLDARLPNQRRQQWRLAAVAQLRLGVQRQALDRNAILNARYLSRMQSVPEMQALLVELLLPSPPVKSSLAR